MSASDPPERTPTLTAEASALHPAVGLAEVRRQLSHAVSVGMSSGSSDESWAGVSLARALAFRRTA